MTRLLFLTRSLNVGGGERQLCELVKGLAYSDFQITVVSFYDGGEIKEELEAIPGIRIISLGKRSRWDVASFLWRLWRTFKREMPHIIHGYMGVANEISLLMGRLVGAKVVWGVRAARVDYSLYDYLSSAFFRVGCWLSRFPDLIIVNSWAGKRHHEDCGYPSDRMVVIPNGIDTRRFTMDARARTKIREEWTIGEREVAIGLVARLDPIKGHRTFFEAAAIVMRSHPEVRFVCVGGGAVPYAQQLRNLADRLGISMRVLWIGHRSDMPAVYNALDIVVSASDGEGFPNTVAEAMACGVPCVVTDVGDSAVIVGELGEVVPPRDAKSLADGLMKMLGRVNVDPSLKQNVRNRVIDRFAPSRCTEKTSEALSALC